MKRLFYIITLVVIAIDQLTKWIIVKNMDLYEQITVIKNFFWITSHRNSGAAWGILQGQMFFFYLITVVVIVALVYYLEKHAAHSKLLMIGLNLILGGAIGNFIDRVFRKEVVDFLDFDIFTYNFPIFNVADSALVIGVGFIIIATFLEDKKQKQVKA